MRTLVIWDTHGEGPIVFFWLDGYYGHLNRVYINQSDGDKAKMDELYNLVFDNITGDSIPNMMVDWPEIRPGTDTVIVAGFLP